MPSRSTKNSSNGRGGHSKSRSQHQAKRKVRGGSKSGRFKSTPEANEKEKTGGREDSQSGLMKTAREHPIASAVTGVGAGLLLVEGARRAMSAWNSSQGRNGNGAVENRDEDDEGQEDQQEDRPAASRQSATDESDEPEDQDDSGSIGEKLQNAGERVSKTTRKAMSSLRTGASTLGHQAQSAFEQGREIGSEFWEDHPLLIGAVALAAGVTLGMLLPSTETEDQWIGKLSDKTAGRAKKAVGEVFEQGKEMFGRAVSEGMDTLAREAEREGLTPARLQRKIKRLGAHVRDAVSDAVQ